MSNKCNLLIDNNFWDLVPYNDLMCLVVSGFIGSNTILMGPLIDAQQDGWFMGLIGKPVETIMLDSVQWLKLPPFTSLFL